MTDELLLLPQQGVPRCGVGLHGLHLWSSKGLGFGFAAGLGVTCFTGAGKHLDFLLPHCGNKMLLGGNRQIHSGCWKVVCPCEIWEVKGLCGEKRSLAVLNIAAEGLVFLGAVSQHICLVPVRCFLLSFDPWAHFGARNCKRFALPTFQCQQDALCSVYLLIGCFYLPEIILCCQNDIKEL